MRFNLVQRGMLLVAIMGAGLLLALGSGYASGQDQGARLAAVSPEQAKGLSARLDAALLPKGSSNLKITKGQTFQLMDGAQSVMTLVPVGFYVMTDSAFLSVCGLYMLPAAGPGRFVTTYGMASDEDDEQVEDYWECARTTAIGVMPNEGAHPRLLLTMAAFSPPQHDTVWPIVLTWDAGNGTYRVSKQVFTDESFVGKATVGKMRRKLLAATGKR
jgi:hypothetical protein